jgi:hypothetical protein
MGFFTRGVCARAGLFRKSWVFNRLGRCLPFNRTYAPYGVLSNARPGPCVASVTHARAVGPYVVPVSAHDLLAVSSLLDPACTTPTSYSPAPAPSPQMVFATAAMWTSRPESCERTLFNTLKAFTHLWIVLLNNLRGRIFGFFWFDAEHSTRWTCSMS